MGFLPLVIGEAERARIQQIITLANERPIPLEVTTLLAKDGTKQQGLYDDFTMVLPMGFPVIYTHETQPKGLFRHLSVSVALEGRVPHPESVRMIMQEFGFINELERCIFWEEKVGENAKTAINVIEPLDGDWEPHKIKSEGSDEVA